MLSLFLTLSFPAKLLTVLLLAVALVVSGVAVLWLLCAVAFLVRLYTIPRYRRRGVWRTARQWWRNELV